MGQDVCSQCKVAILSDGSVSGVNLLSLSKGGTDTCSHAFPSLLPLLEKDKSNESEFLVLLPIATTAC